MASTPLARWLGRPPAALMARIAMIDAEWPRLSRRAREAAMRETEVLENLLLARVEAGTLPLWSGLVHGRMVTRVHV